MRMLLPINVEVAVATTVTLKHIGIPYGWGDKVDTSVPLQVFINFCKSRGVDCSGYIDWLVQFASKQGVHWPEGSIAIGEHLATLAAQGVVEACEYAECAQNDGILRICGFNHGGENRHVFGVHNQFTLESHGSTLGVDRRPYTHASLMDQVQWCYRVALPENVVEPTPKPEPKPGPKPEPPDVTEGTVWVKFDENVELQNADGSSRGLMSKQAGVTSDGRIAILSAALPHILQGLNVTYVKPNVIVRQLALPKA